MANVLPEEKRVDVVSHLTEGAGIRPTSRLTGVSQPAILSLLLRVGDGCDRLHDRLVRDLDIRQIQADEIWSFVQKKQARLTAADPPERGDTYTFVALARSAKLVIAYRVGKRDDLTTRAFINDLRARLLVVPEIHLDGFPSYPAAVGGAFGANGVDLAVVQKHYTRKGKPDGQPSDHRYEPPRHPFITRHAVFGAPDTARASTWVDQRAGGPSQIWVRRFPFQE